MDFSKFKRKIQNISDLTSEEQQLILKDIDTLPCIPVSLKFLKDNYQKLIDMDFSKVKESDLNKIHLLTPEQVRTIMMHDYDSLRAMALVIQTKTIYAKAHEAHVIDKDNMNMELDEFRARCQLEYEEQEKINKFYEQTEKETTEVKD